MSNFSLFIFAGEPSGDKHGAEVINCLASRNANFSCVGVGGPAMRAAGLQTVLPMEEFAVMGFSDVIKALPRLYRHFHTVLNAILDLAPKVVLLIDYPGFNLRLAKALKKRGYRGKIVQYVAPMVWAWGKERIAAMERDLDQLLVIYPFELDCFAGSKLPTAYVGNPVSEAHTKYQYQSDWLEKVGLPSERAPIALFPGSRAAEIGRNLPLQLAAVKKLQQIEPNLPVAISCSSEAQRPLIEKLASQSGLKDGSWKIISSGYTYELMAACESAIAKSGTVTLELALHGCPTVVTYLLTPLNKFLARYWMKLNLSHYCIVNLLSQKTVFPELIAKEPTPEVIFENLHSLRKNREICREACHRLKSLLNEKEASVEVAQHLERLWSSC